MVQVARAIQPSFPAYRPEERLPTPRLSSEPVPQPALLVGPLCVPPGKKTACRASAVTSTLQASGVVKVTV